MKLVMKSILAASVMSAAFSASVRAEETPEHSFATKVTLISEYEYRGLTQTAEKPAVQLNLDYAHKSGFYLGTFLTNISWIKDTKDEFRASSGKGPVEWDIFGGYKFEIAKDWTMDVGYLHYEYPSAKGLAGLPKPNTDELYVGLSYDAWNVKYSYSTGDTFGVPKSKGTTFLELNYSKEIAPKLTLTAQIAQQKYKGNFGGFNNDKELTYSVYKAGLSYDLGDGWTAGGYAKDTNAKEANYTIKGKDWSKARLVAFVSKSF